MKLGYNVIVPTADQLFTLLLHAAKGEIEGLLHQVAAHFGQYLAELAMGQAWMPRQPLAQSFVSAWLIQSRVPEMRDASLLMECRAERV